MPCSLVCDGGVWQGFEDIGFIGAVDSQAVGSAGAYWLLRLLQLLQAL